MRKLSAFNFITLNGFYKDSQESIHWHQHGGEEASFSVESMQQGNALLFGRVTYEHMKQFWPTAEAAELFPEMAKGMNQAEKIVFSTTLLDAGWNNASVISANIEEAIRKIKQSEGNNMTILGSGSILTQLTNAKLIDEYQLMIDPIVIGKGTPLFENILNPTKLKLTNSRIFQSGVVLLTYQPA